MPKKKAAKPAGPEADLPNPSFIVVRLESGSARAGVERALAARMGWPEQTLLFPLAPDAIHAMPGELFVLARAAAKRLAVLEGSTDGVLAMLLAQDGITAAVRQDAWTIGGHLAEEGAARPAAGRDAPQWYLDRIRAREAWRMLGSDPEDLPWRGVKVGHVDTGITRHRVFGDAASGRSWVLWDQGINYKESGELPVDPANYKGWPGHGTRTASVLCGRAPADGFWGVAPGVSVVPYRITDGVVIDFLGNKTRIGAALLHATLDAGCHVISISLGCPCLPTPQMGAGVDRAYEEGVIVVAAAGNVTSEVTYPGRFSRAITAGGSTPGDTPWLGGSRGAKVDISAPADGIWRADVGDVYGGGGDGTSYAAAMTAGAAALWRAVHAAELANAYARGWQIVEAFRTCLKRSARQIPGWPTSEYGTGILDVEALLRMPLPSAASLVEVTTRAEGQRF